MINYELQNNYPYDYKIFVILKCFKTYIIVYCKSKSYETKIDINGTKCVTYENN